MANIKRAPKSIETTSVFFGYNNNKTAANGEFTDTLNLTSSYFPLFASRHKRASFPLVTSEDGLCSLFAKDKLFYINNGKLYYGGEVVTGINLSPLITNRQMVSMGAYLLIFPDLIYVNTSDETDKGSFAASFTTTGSTEFSPCRADGTAYDNYIASDTAPAEPKDGNLWYDTENNLLKWYSELTSMWIAVETTYVKIASPNIGKAFNKGDGVNISGASDAQFNATFVLPEVFDDFIVVTGNISSPIIQSTPITIKREVPEMDFVVSGENRVWGCNSEKNEVYACKLGDFRNWNCFGGLSTDSYAASVGTDGKFTGAIRYLSSILFFKENYVHKIYNTNPPYIISTSRIKGVQKGSHRSLCIVNGSLFYLSQTGICMYEGSLPKTVPNVLGTEYYHSGVAGEFRNKYYICMSSGVDKRQLFVYDTEKDIWHKEGFYTDAIDIKEFASYNSNLFFIYKDEDENMLRLGLIDTEQPYGAFTGQLSGYREEPFVLWSAKTGMLGITNASHSYVKTVFIRYSLKDTKDEKNPAFINVYARYDSTGEWELLDSTTESETHSYILKSHILRKCDHMQLKFTGRGECRIYSITLSYEMGGQAV
ncbi:MAG TPA: hypothetical protein VFC76_08070 [Oscillospiraceae bacterium]|nr:hypothetical protein [Oscillospiraceae bacterium]